VRSFAYRSCRCFLLPATLIASLSSCDLGPEHKRPSLPENAGYSDGPLPEGTAATEANATDAQRFLSGRDIPGDWWKVFGSPALGQLITAAFENSPDIDAAKATLRQALENGRATSSGWLPSIEAKGSRTDVGFSAATIGQTYTAIFTLSTAQLNLSYPLDFFGMSSKTKVAIAQIQDQRFQLEAAYVTLSSNIVVAAIQEASLRAQIEATQTLIATKTRLLGLIERQFDLGGATMADVLTQRSAVAQSETNLPSLRSNLEQQRTLLRMLAGRLPSGPLFEQFSFDDLRLPEEVPVSLPSRLVEQRPDVRSSEEQLRAAAAQVGVAIAAMLPQISLSGSAGNTAISALSFPIWNYGFSVTIPIFDAGKLIHQRRAADAGLDIAAARYRGAVLHAFREVSDSLRALQGDAEAVAAQRKVEKLASESLSIAEKQLSAGSGSVLTLLNSQSQFEQARLGLIQAQAKRFSDTAALYQALGGGWWNRPGVTSDKQDIKP
jgi:NodT family efflux transporter outer membrane factor (OMF) lipoprotein